MVSDFLKTAILAIISSGVLSSVIAAVVSGIQSKNTMSKGLKHVLYFQIKQGCKDALRDGTIDDDSLQALHEAWEIYHDKLGGNGYLTALMSKVDKLPLTNDNE